MKITLDTNILIYASLKNAFVRAEIEYISDNYTLVLSQYVIDEYIDVIGRSNIVKYNPINILETINYKVIDTEYIDYYLFEIRDKDDYQVLYDAILNDVDIFITNDKDFVDVKVCKPRIMTTFSIFTRVYARRQLSCLFVLIS